MIVLIVIMGQQYNVEEKPTVILCSYINRHAGTPNKTKPKSRLRKVFNAGRR